MTVYTLSPEEMTAVFRYEQTFYPYRGGRVQFSGTCQVALADLEAAIYNIEKQNPAVGALVRYWYAPLSRLGDFFGIGTACGYDEETTEVRIRGIPTEESELFYSLWSRFEAISHVPRQDAAVGEFPVLKVMQEELRLWLENREKELQDWQFSVPQLRQFLRQYRTWRCPNAEERELYERFCPPEPVEEPIAVAAAEPPSQEPSGELYRIVRIFNLSKGRTYDYLTDDDTIKVNDRVEIWSFHEKIVVPVCGVFQRYESELELDWHEYRRIIRKIETGACEDDL